MCLTRAEFRTPTWNLSRIDLMRKYAVLIYPDFSLQEITCLTSALTV